MYCNVTADGEEEVTYRAVQRPLGVALVRRSRDVT